MLLIIMGFLIVVIIYINMQRECRDGEVCAKSTSTQNPGARKPVHAGTDTSQNSKSRSATADRLNSLRIDFPEKRAKIKVWKLKTVATSRHT